MLESISVFEYASPSLTIINNEARRLRAPPAVLVLFIRHHFVHVLLVVLLILRNPWPEYVYLFSNRNGTCDFMTQVRSSSHIEQIKLINLSTLGISQPLHSFPSRFLRHGLPVTLCCSTHPSEVYQTALSIITPNKYIFGIYIQTRHTYSVRPTSHILLHPACNPVVLSVKALPSLRTGSWMARRPGISVHRSHPTQSLDR